MTPDTTPPAIFTDDDPAHPFPTASSTAASSAGPTTVPARSHSLSWVLIAAAVFALTLAVALPILVYPRFAVLPRDPQRTSVQHATGATVLVPDSKAPGNAKVLKNVPVRVRTYVAAADGSAAQSLGESVVWQIATRVEVPGHGLVNARIETVSLHRHTAEPTNCCGDRLVTSILEPNGEPLQHRGMLAFPFNLQRRSYPVWDVTLRRARIAKFVGQEQHAGLRTYKFQATTPLVGVGTRQVPGPLFGIRDAAVTAQVEYADTRTYWVEPVTGAVVSTRDKVTQQYRYGERVVTAMSADIQSEPPSQDTVNTLRTGARMMPLLRWQASIALPGIAALLLLTAYRRTRRSPRGSAH
jgi:hypothetical protein